MSLAGLLLTGCLVGAHPQSAPVAPQAPAPTPNATADANPEPPLMHQVPRRVFEVVIDGFKQATSATISCGSLPAPIASIAALPAVDHGAGFSFEASEGALTLRLARADHKKRIAAGKFSWTGPELTWNWNTFPAVDAGASLTELRQFLASSAFVATLTDGKAVVLSPPGSEGLIAATIKEDGVMHGSVALTTVPDGVMLTVEQVAGAAWIGTSSDRGIVTGTIDGHPFEITLAKGVCTVQQVSPKVAELKSLAQQLVDNKQVISSLSASQKKILNAETAAITVKIATLKTEVESDRLKGLKSTLRIRATDAASGRVYGRVTATLES